MTTLRTHWKGSRRADFGDFSRRSFAIQVKFNTGWETVEEPSPFVVEQAWAAARKRWPSLRLRLSTRRRA